MAQSAQGVGFIMSIPDFLDGACIVFGILICVIALTSDGHDP